MRKCISLSGAALTLGILITPSPADSSSAIRVGVPQLAPCSTHEGEQFSGSVYQLWQEASADLPVRHSIKSIASLQKGIQELRNNSIDILVTCLAITPERASSIEYSFPVMEDGIRLLQKKKNATALDYVKPLVFNEVATLSIVTLIACSLIFSVALHFNEQGSCSFISRQDFPKKATTILRTAASFIAGSSIQNEAQKTSSIPLWTVAGITRACLIALLTAGITKGLISETNPVKFAPVAKRDNWLDPHKRYGVIEGSAEEEFLKIFEENVPGGYRFVAGFPNTSKLAEALKGEEVDYAFIQASVADEIMAENRFKGLFATDEDEESLNIPHSLGYNKNLDPSIRSVINQGIIRSRFRNEINAITKDNR